MRIRTCWPAALLALVISSPAQTQPTNKPRMSFDEFFNGIEISEVNISPDGRAVLIETTRPDWEQEINRRDIWLWREGGSLVSADGSSA